MTLGAFSFIYDVFRVSVEAKDVIKRAIVFIGSCLRGKSLLHASSFITNEVNL